MHEREHEKIDSQGYERSMRENMTTDNATEKEKEKEGKQIGLRMVHEREHGRKDKVNRTT